MGLVNLGLLPCFLFVVTSWLMPPSYAIGITKDALTQWLYNLTLYLPDQDFHESIFSLRLVDLSCTHFEVTSIRSSWASVRFNVSIKSLTATCRGSYHSTGLSGQVDTTLALSDSDMILDLQVGRRNTTLADNKTQVVWPTNVTLPACICPLEAQSLHFTGSLSAKLIGLFEKPIRNYITGALSSQVCPALQMAVETNGTQLIQKVNQYLDDLIGERAPISSDTDSQLSTPGNDKKVSFESEFTSVLSNYQLIQVDESAKTSEVITVPVVNWILTVTNKLFKRYLNKGLVLDLLEYVFGSTYKVTQECGYFFRGWNGLIASLTRNGTANVKIPKALQKFTFSLPQNTSISLQIKQLTFGGLHQWDKFQVALPISSTTFETLLFTPHAMNVSADIVLQIHQPVEVLEESFRVSMKTSSLNLSTDWVLDWNETGLQQTTMGQIMKQSSFKCLFSALLKKVSIPRLEWNYPVITAIEIQPCAAASSSSLERDLDELLNHAIQLVLKEFGTLVTVSSGAFVKGPLKQASERGVQKWLSPVSACPNSSPHPVSNVTQYINFTQSRLLHHFQEVLKEGRRGINDYLHCLSDTVSTVVHKTEPAVNFSQLASLQWIDLKLENFDTLQAIELLSPQLDYRLSNKLEMGLCSTNASKDDDDELNCTGPQVIANFDVNTPHHDINATISLAASLGRIQESITALFLYDIEKFSNLSLSKILASPACIMWPAAEAVLYAMPQTLINQVSVSLDAHVRGFGKEDIDLYLNSSRFPCAVSAVKSTASWAQRNVVDTLNRMLARVMKDANRTYHEDNDSDSFHADERIRAVLFAVVHIVPFYIMSHIFYIGYKSRSSTQTGSHSDGSSSDEEVRDLVNEGGRFIHPGHLNPRLRLVFDKNLSLMTRERISSHFRHIFPIFLLGTIAVLIASNLSVGASVDLSVSTTHTKEVLRIPSLFGFSLGHTIHEMLHAGIYVLLFIVLVFSGIWPYAKLLLMLFAWFVPEPVYSAKSRGKLLFSLDALSKFSLVDTFVLVLMMVAFRFHLALGDNAFIDVFVNPKFGFFGFLLATTASLLAGHVELNLHRLCEDRRNDDGGLSKESLFSHAFQFRGKKYQFSYYCKFVLITAMAIVFLLLFFGSFLESFIFEFGGLAGSLLGDESKKSYSLLSIGKAIPEAVEDPSGAGIMFLQVVYFFYASIMPFACLMVLCSCMIIPMTRSQQEFWLSAAEVANAWSSIEVFALSIIAALFEITTFASFIVGEKCDVINQILEDQFDSLLNGDDKCYSVNARVHINASFLVLGVILNSFLVSTMLRVIQIVVEERGVRVYQGCGHFETNMDENNDLNIVQHLIASGVGDYLFVEAEEVEQEAAADFQLLLDEGS